MKGIAIILITSLVLSLDYKYRFSDTVKADSPVGNFWGFTKYSNSDCTTASITKDNLKVSDDTTNTLSSLKGFSTSDIVMSSATSVGLMQAGKLSKGDTVELSIKFTYSNYNDCLCRGYS